ncbi:MAG: hypothetical protein ACFCD0_01060 [Gemmataceae bacterium]
MIGHVAQTVLLALAIICIGCGGNDARVAKLETEVAALKQEVSGLREEMVKANIPVTVAPRSVKKMSPGNTLKHAIEAANDGVYSQADKYLLKTVYEQWTKAGAETKILWDAITRKGTVAKITILEEKVRGEGATVSLKLTYKNAMSVQAQLTLVQHNGRWGFNFLELSKYVEK